MLRLCSAQEVKNYFFCPRIARIFNTAQRLVFYTTKLMDYRVAVQVLLKKFLHFSAPLFEIPASVERKAQSVKRREPSDLIKSTIENPNSEFLGAEKKTTLLEQYSLIYS